MYSRLFVGGLFSVSVAGGSALVLCSDEVGGRWYEVFRVYDVREDNFVSSICFLCV